jgi:hypothetical protein
MVLNKRWLRWTGLFLLWLIFCGQIYFPSAVCPSSSLLRIVDSLLYVLTPIIALVVAFRTTRTFKFNKKSYNLAVRLISIPVIMVLFCICSFYSNLSFRKLGWKQMVHRGTLVIAEIEKYRAKHSKYPDILSDIDVEDISTGVCGFDKFSHRIFDDGSYELSVFMPEVGINFSELIYWPSKDYSSIRDPITRIGDWAFIHE